MQLNHPRKNEITLCCGNQEGVRVEYSTIPVKNNTLITALY